MHHFQVPDMTCSHCSATVERVVKSVDAEAKVAVDLATKDVRVTSSADLKTLLTAIEDVGYTPKVAAAP